MRPPRFILFIIGAVVGAALAGGVAFASIPDSNGVIHGCYANHDGSLRVIDSSTQNCRKREAGLNWVQTTPKVISGYVLSDGVAGRSTGYTSQKLGVGHYEVDFPPGTWCVGGPCGVGGVMPVVSYSGGGGANGYAIVEGVNPNPDGSANFTVVTVDGTSQQRGDAIF